MLEPAGLIISPAFNFSWEQRTIPIKGGRDRIVMFSDATVEAESESGQYGVERLVEEVQKGPMDGNALAGQILESVRQFMVGRPIHDDLTLVIR